MIRAVGQVARINSRGFGRFVAKRVAPNQGTKRALAPSYRFPDTLCRDLKNLADHQARFMASVFHLLGHDEFSHQVLVLEPFP